MSALYSFLTLIMNWCYGLCHNYGIAIVIFTFISKIILLPVSIWTLFNSIKMIKIQPDINNIKAKYYGQNDIISEMQAELYKKEGYHPILSTIPLFVQLILLVGVVGTIRIGMNNPEIDMHFGGLLLSLVPANEGLSLLFAPIIAGISAFLLCIAQNASNVLQSEQTNGNKYGTMAFSVGISLYLGWFVPVGTAWYWVCSNLMSIAQLYILNAIFRPYDKVDQVALEESRKRLGELQSVGKTKKEGYFSETRIKERKDYKRFFSVVNKHVVFYSESNGFYKYFKAIIEYLLEHTNITIHYITSDPKDNIFELEKTNSRIRGYYIGENKLITLMMKMDADVVIMTMPDIENYHIKRSYVRKDVEYVYLFHGMGSVNLLLRKGCVDHYDTVFVVGPSHKAEVRETEKLYNLPEKRIVEYGYSLLDDMLDSYNNMVFEKHDRKRVLIAPSWQKDNIIDLCIEELLNGLKGGDYDIIVRPHPQEVRNKKSYLEALEKKFSCDNIEFQMDFSSNNPILEADLLITDWSSIAYDYAFSTKRPVLYVNTPMKVMNEDYKKISTIPMDIAVRDELGMSIEIDELDKASEFANELLQQTDKYSQQIVDSMNRNIYGIGTHGEIGAKYIIEAVQRHIADKKKGN